MKFFGIILLLIGLSPAAADNARINSLRMWTSAEKTRLVFDLTKPVKRKIFQLDNPNRLVIDIDAARWAAKLPAIPANHPTVRRIRGAARGNGGLRVVIDLASAIKQNNFSLEPNKPYGHRLVIDVFQNNRPTNHKAALQDKPRTIKLPIKQAVISVPSNRNPPKIVVAIDAGHGGEDSGARGPGGTREKDVVFAIAKKLAKRIDSAPEMRAVLVRTGDFYVDLKRRRKIAREARADLFVSIHADAFRSSNVRGSSVFILSPRGASSVAARWLADKENASDLIGGVSLDDKDNLLASVLLDLSQSATREVSQEVAEKVLRNLGRTGKVHRPHIQKAGFVVLKSPDIPSILVETAFISNPGEEKKLRSPTHQARIADAIFTGINEYFSAHTLPSTRVAARKHTISRGETLSEIAERYGVSMRELLARNSLSGYGIRIGQILEIPTGS